MLVVLICSRIKYTSILLRRITHRIRAGRLRVNNNNNNNNNNNIAFIYAPYI